MSWAIVCDARKGRDLGITTLAMVDRRKCQKLWWTSDAPGLVMQFSEIGKAQKAISRLTKNNPRIVSYENAIAVIGKQCDRILTKKLSNDDNDDEAKRCAEAGWDGHKGYF